MSNSTFGAFGSAGTTITTILGGPVNSDNSGKGQQALSEPNSFKLQVGTIGSVRTLVEEVDSNVDGAVFDVHKAKVGNLNTIVPPATVMTKLAEKAEASTLTSLENTIEAKIGNLNTIPAPSTLMSQVAGAIQSLNEHKLKIGNLDTIAPATLIQKLADVETAIAGLSPGSGPSSTTTWMQSPDYDLGSHPNDSTVVRWAHMQSDPIQVHMYVRVRDASENERGEHVYPYADIRVQPRYVATNDMPFVRYLKLNFREHPVAITFVHVKIRTFDPASPNPNPFWIDMTNRRVQYDNLMDLDKLEYP
jgi:hypothetical protein